MIFKRLAMLIADLDFLEVTKQKPVGGCTCMINLDYKLSSDLDSINLDYKLSSNLNSSFSSSEGKNLLVVKQSTTNNSRGITIKQTNTYTS